MSKNGKALSAKQLGIPSGVRLSKNVVENIIRVAIREGFNEQGMLFAEIECGLINCINEYAYPTKDRIRYQEAMQILSGKPYKDTFDGFRAQTGVGMAITPNGVQTIKLGNTGYYYNTDVQTGVLHSRDFEQFIKEEDVGKNWETEGYHTSTEYRWLDRHCVFIQPDDSNLHLDEGEVWKRLPAQLQHFILIYVKNAGEFLKKMEAAKESLGRILATYTSAVKLCNDAPEFVDWINKTEGMNAQGRKCTDVTLADDVADMRKHLSL